MKVLNTYIKGHTKRSYESHLEFYGKNQTIIKEKPIYSIMMDEILSPFYLFEILSVILWFNIQYVPFAIVILITSVFAVILALYDYKKNFRRIQELSAFEIIVQVHRRKDENDLNDFTFESIYSSELVPGDLIKIPERQIMPCDIILLNGSAIMNESVLTGESIPVKKSKLPSISAPYLPNDDSKKNTLFAGTKCIVTRNVMKDISPVVGVVTSTGFNTIKGSLIRSILFSKNNDFEFYKDAIKFIFCMFFVAIGGIIFTLYVLTAQGSNFSDIFLQSLDLFTVSVPPALPACMSMGITLSLVRLKKKSIYSISPLKVNVAGKVNFFCFDKTGTLTEDDLDTKGVIPVIKGRLSREVEIPSLRNGKLLEMLASCHSLTRVNNKLLGDPLDLKMFKSTNWIMEENFKETGDQLIEAEIHNPLKISQTIAILRRNDFSSRSQRMSVVVKSEKGFEVFVKGSPEKIRELCRAETIPENFHDVLELYAKVNFTFI